jgi:hypothetical protein
LPQALRYFRRKQDPEWSDHSLVTVGAVASPSWSDRSRDRLDAEEHRLRLGHQQSFPHPHESLKTEPFVERHRVRLRVGYHPDTAQEISLFERQAQDVTKECGANSEALGLHFDT